MIGGFKYLVLTAAIHLDEDACGAACLYLPPD
jgi:hypothetical protein